MRLTRMVMAFALIAMVLAACTSSGSSVDVSLYEWGLDRAPTSVSAGDVTFKATNDGSETHEMVVVKADSAADIPTDADGAADESQMDETVFIGEVEDVEAGANKSVTLTLEPGTYVIFCNVTETESDGTVESHFAKGMYNTITVS